MNKMNTMDQEADAVAGGPTVVMEHKIFGGMILAAESAINEWRLLGFRRTYGDTPEGATLRGCLVVVADRGPLRMRKIIDGRKIARYLRAGWHPTAQAAAVECVRV